jgi:aspartyl-tRNA(Asn)/glutamyl-tRNA(Gln) amidotransferase subunit A
MSSDTWSAHTWDGDAVGLVEAFRAGERSPSEELEATFAAVDASDLNAVCFEDRDAARAAAAAAAVSG